MPLAGGAVLYARFPSSGTCSLCNLATAECLCDCMLLVGCTARPRNMLASDGRVFCHGYFRKSAARLPLRSWTRHRKLSYQESLLSRRRWRFPSFTPSTVCFFSESCKSRATADLKNCLHPCQLCFTLSSAHCDHLQRGWDFEKLFLASSDGISLVQCGRLF